MSDNYEFSRSSHKQSQEDYTPYQSKQFNFINDTNSGIYNNNSLTLVQFDLSSIYNSQTFVDTNDSFLILPITYVLACGAGGAPVAPAAGSSSLASIKSNYLHLIHQVDCQINGKSIESTQPFQNVATSFRLMSEMSQNDLKQMGPTLGFADVLDNQNSMVLTAAAVPTFRSRGISNNIPFSPSTTTFSPIQGSTGVQNFQVSNDALTKKLARVYDSVSASNGFTTGTTPILSTTGLSNELRPYYTVLNTNYNVWYDSVVIKLSTLMDSFGSIGLVKKFDCVLRIWVNTGNVSYTVTNATSAFEVNANTFTNTCPLLISNLSASGAALNAIYGATTSTITNITAGLFVARAPTQTGLTLNVGTSGAQHSLQACRIYYSQVVLNPSKALEYISSNRQKLVKYRNIISNQYAVSLGGFNQLVTSGVINPLGLLIVPYIGSTNSTIVPVVGSYQWQNAFDTCPATSSPCSLTNIQVGVGGVNQLSDTLFYTFQNFITQVSQSEQLTSSDFGVTTGLFTEAWWMNNKHYYVNISRCAPADKLTPRNITVSFTNNSPITLDVLIFIIYSDSFVIDVETGIVKK